MTLYYVILQYITWHIYIDTYVHTPVLLLGSRDSHSQPGRNIQGPKNKTHIATMLVQHMERHGEIFLPYQDTSKCLTTRHDHFTQTRKCISLLRRGLCKTQTENNPSNHKHHHAQAPPTLIITSCQPCLKGRRNGRSPLNKEEGRGTRRKIAI